MIIIILNLLTPSTHYSQTQIPRMRFCLSPFLVAKFSPITLILFLFLTLLFLITPISRYSGDSKGVVEREGGAIRERKGKMEKEFKEINE